MKFSVRDLLWIVHFIKLCRILFFDYNVAILVHFSHAVSYVYHRKVQMKCTFVCLQIRYRDQTCTLALERTEQFDACLDSVPLVCEGESKRCCLTHLVKDDKCVHDPTFSAIASRVIIHKQVGDTQG